jgi:formate hydrogenlyase subunit 4
LVSTVTTSSISIIASAEFAIYLALAAVLSLLVTLAIKELATVSAGAQQSWFSRSLNGPVVVLAMVFVFVVAAKVSRVLS